jgi:hypothetical protein
MNSLVRGLWNRNRFRCFLFFLVLLLTLGSLSTAATLSSPDGRLVLTVETTADWPYAERFAEGSGQAAGELP